MNRKNVYLLLCAVGFVLPYLQFVPWLIEHRSLATFVHDMLANRISAFFVADVVVSAAVLVVFMRTERKRWPIQHAWAPILALVTVGVSLALPLFLYLRECAMEKERPSSSTARA